MAVIPFNEWLPDEAELGNRGTPYLVNALPGPTSYKPVPSLEALTQPLNDYCRGAIDIRSNDLNVFQFAGDAAKLYQLSQDTWNDVSQGSGYSTGQDERWAFQLWKNKVLATNFSDNIQSIDLGAASFSDLTADFRARQLAVVNQHVLAANTFDSVGGAVPDRLRTSAFNDETDWTPDSTTGATSRDLGGGPIQRLFGGEFGAIMTKDRTYRAVWLGAPDWFAVDETIPGIGTVAAGASAQLGNRIFTFSQHGFFVITNATAAEPIGAGRVDKFMLDDLDDKYLHRISTVTDPASGRVFWAYPGAGNVGGQPNKIIVFDSHLNKWGIIEQEVQLLWRAGGIGFTLEQLDTQSTSIDDLAFSLDSSVWKGDGTQTLSAFDGQNQHGFFRGTPMTAVIRTKETEIHQGHKTLLQGFTPLVQGGSVSARVGYRNNLQDAVAFTSSCSVGANGRCKSRKRARYHQIELTASGAWEDAIGVSIDPYDARKSGRR